MNVAIAEKRSFILCQIVDYIAQGLSCVIRISAPESTGRSWRVQPDVPLAFINAFVSLSRFCGLPPSPFAKTSELGLAPLGLRASRR